MKATLIFRTAILTMGLLLACNTRGQNLPKRLEQIVQTLESQTDDAALAAFLRKEGLFDPEQGEGTGVEFIGEPGEAPAFSAANLTTEVAQCNLFGDAAPEYILSILSDSNCVVNVFHLQKGKLMRVPGRLGLVIYLNTSIYDLGMGLRFEEVAEAGRFTMISEIGTGFNRFLTVTAKLWNVDADGMASIYSFEKESYDYSGVLTYENSLEQPYTFLSDGGFPKELLIKHTAVSKESELDGNGEEVSGSTTTTSGTITVEFSSQNGRLTVANETRDLKTEVERFDQATEEDSGDED